MQFSPAFEKGGGVRGAAPRVILQKRRKGLGGLPAEARSGETLAGGFPIKLRDLIGKDGTADGCPVLLFLF